MPAAIDFMNDHFKNLLNSTRVYDIAPKWYSVIFAKTNDSISTVFKRMIDHEIRSMPLYDEKEERYIAFVDIFDILAYIVEVVGIPTDNHEELVMISEFNSTLCAVLPDLSMRNPWNTIHKDAPLQDVINILSQTGIYRIAIVDSDGKLISVLTQSRVVNFLAEKSDVIGPLTKLPIKSMGFGNNPVIGIKETEPAINAFLKIYQYNIGGVVVYNDKEQVIGNISISDLKDIGYSLDKFNRLFISSKEFLSRKIEGSHVPQLIYITKDDKIEVLFEKLRLHSINRIYVIDLETKKSLGVISGSDIVCMFDSKASPPIYLEESSRISDRTVLEESQNIAEKKVM